MVIRCFTYRYFVAKVIFILLLTINFLRVSAQQVVPIPDEVIPDVDGRAWRIYKLLDEGKSVVLVFFTTDCLSCWTYYKDNILQQYAAQYGPNGSNKSQVIFIESDPNTQIDCLYDRSKGCSSFTFGNWVENANFPVADYARLADLMQIKQFPTVVIACPNRRGVKIEQGSSLNIAQLWERATACPNAFGARNVAVFNASTGSDIREVCGSLLLNPVFSMMNLGSEDLRSTKIELLWNGKVVEERRWQGFLPLYGEARIRFDSLRVFSGGKLSFRVGIDDAPDEQPENNQLDIDLTQSVQFMKRVILQLETDKFGSDIYWEVRNSAGKMVDMGGNNLVGPNGGGQFPNGAPVGPGAYGPRMKITDTLMLPGFGCYSIHFVDGFGDGICCGQGRGYYSLSNVDTPNQPLIVGGNFQATDVRTFSLVNGSTSSTAEATTFSALHIYPNPAFDVVQVNLELSEPVQDLTYTMFDQLGRLRHQASVPGKVNGTQNLQFSVYDWSAGIYFLQIQTDKQRVVRSFAVTK
jgi:Secretion system C-terminal sorting domain